MPQPEQNYNFLLLLCIVVRSIRKETNDEKLFAEKINGLILYFAEKKSFFVFYFRFFFLFSSSAKSFSSSLYYYFVCARDEKKTQKTAFNIAIKIKK